MPIRLFFTREMQVEVPEGTVLRFHPTSHSPTELSRMLTVQFLVEGIIFETKEAVLEKVPGTFFYSHHAFPLHAQGLQLAHEHELEYHLHDFHGIAHHHVNDPPSDHEQDDPREVQRVLENSDGLEFFPIMFDYMRRKYDRLDKDFNMAAVMAFTRYMSPAQVQHFYNVFHYYGLPGGLVDNVTLGLNLVEENKTTLMLAEKEFVSEEHYTSCIKTLLQSIDDNEPAEFCDFLLQRVNQLSVGSRRLEQLLLNGLCAISPDSFQLCMLATLFNPNEFGGRFFAVPSNAHYTVFVDMIPFLFRSSQTDKEDRSVEERFKDFTVIVDVLVKQLGMPINVPNGVRCVSGYHFSHTHLLEWAKRQGSWMAFTLFLQYFPELKRGPEFLVAGFDRSIFHLGDHLNDPDLPFLFGKLIYWMSLAEFERAKLQVTNSIEENKEIIAHRMNPYNHRLLLSLSEAVDKSITVLQQQRPPP